MPLPSGTLVERHHHRSIAGIAANQLQPVGNVPFEHVVPLPEDQEVEAAGRQEELMHRVQHHLPAEVPHAGRHMALLHRRIQAAGS